MTKILVPLDGSDFAAAALGVADGLAKGMGAELVLVSVGELPETSAHESTEHRDLGQMLHKASSQVSSPTRSRVQPAGDPVRGILEVADEEQVDLIVMSTHGRSGLEELAQGSIALGLVHDGSYPVALVRPPEEIG